MGYRKGQYEHLHPNDDVNCSQSTNDAYPTAIKLGVILTLRDAVSAFRELREALKAKAAEFADVLKMGRTENQDAVPMTLGQEFNAYAVMIGDGIRYLERAGEELHEMNMSFCGCSIRKNTLTPPRSSACSRMILTRRSSWSFTG